MASYYFDNSKISNLESKGITFHNANGCQSQKYKFRFYLKIDLNSGSGTAVVIMKNPASACKNNLCINRAITKRKD